MQAESVHARHSVSVRRGGHSSGRVVVPRMPASVGRWTLDRIARGQHVTRARTGAVWRGTTPILGCSHRPGRRIRMAELD